MVVASAPLVLLSPLDHMIYRLFAKNRRALAPETPFPEEVPAGDRCRSSSFFREGLIAGYRNEPATDSRSHSLHGRRDVRSPFGEVDAEVAIPRMAANGQSGGEIEQLLKHLIDRVPPWNHLDPDPGYRSISTPGRSLPKDSLILARGHHLRRDPRRRHSQ